MLIYCHFWGLGKFRKIFAKKMKPAEIAELRWKLKRVPCERLSGTT